MRVTYVPIDSERVSKEWGVVLHDMRAHGVSFRVNEGHRTMARQLYFWNLYRSGRGNLAAYPSSNAPHIRSGRIDHAIDFGNAAGAMAWLRAVGMNPTLTVPGESWHVEVPAGELSAYARSHGGNDPVIKPFYAKPFRPNKQADVRRLQGLLEALNMKVPNTGRYDLATRKAVRRFQHRHGIKVDGIVGPGTWRALRKASK